MSVVDVVDVVKFSESSLREELQKLFNKNTP